MQKMMAGDDRDDRDDFDDDASFGEEKGVWDEEIDSPFTGKVIKAF